MRTIDSIRDVEQLRQVAILLEKENENLHQRLARQVSELAKLRGEEPTSALQLELTRLKEQLNLATKRAKGNRSERRKRDKGKKKRRDKQPGHGPREQPRLPIDVQTHVLGETELSCGSCRGELRRANGRQTHPQMTGYASDSMGFREACRGRQIFADR